MKIKGTVYRTVYQSREFEIESDTDLNQADKEHLLYLEAVNHDWNSTSSDEAEYEVELDE